MQEGEQPKTLNVNAAIPTIYFDNVQFKNFFVDNQALIYVERDNIIHHSVENPNNPQEQLNHFEHIGNYEMTADIYFSNSMVYDCSFELGMIFVPKIVQVGPEWSGSTLRRYVDEYVP